MLPYRALIILFLIGSISLIIVLSQDCSDVKPQEPIFVNTTSNITFHIESNRSSLMAFEIFRELENSRLIFRIYIHYKNDYDIFYYDYSYKNRTSLSFVKTESDFFIVFYITITGAEQPDSGTPITTLAAIPAVVEEGDVGRLKCISISTTIPDTHNLTFQTSWYTDGRLIRTVGRFRVIDDELVVFRMSRNDTNLDICCKVKEDLGLTSSTCTAMTVNSVPGLVVLTRQRRLTLRKWRKEGIIGQKRGPSPGPELQPPSTFYQLEPGGYLPDIFCSVDCHPECKLTWIKTSNQRVLSYNGTLSLGKTDENSTGEYSCTATREGTIKRKSIAIVVLIKQEKELPPEFSQNYTPVMAVGGGLGAALLVTVLVIVCLLVRGNPLNICRKHSSSKQQDDSVELTTQTMSYDNVAYGKSPDQTYETTTTDLKVTKGIDTQGRQCVQPEEELYENTTLH